MASKPVKDLAEVARLQNLLFANHLVLRAKRAPHRLVPVDYETAESLREHLDDDVWEEYINIHDKFHENRCRFIDDQALDDDLEGLDGEDLDAEEDEDYRANEMDLNDPFINDGELDYITPKPVSLSAEDKRKRLLSQMERKKRELERLEKKLKGV